MKKIIAFWIKTQSKPMFRTETWNFKDDLKMIRVWIGFFRICITYY